MSQKKFFAIGIMSGTSLDGLDLAYCSYTVKKSKWSFKLYKGETIVYDDFWRSKLDRAHTLPGEDLMKLHSEYGKWIGHICKSFIKQNGITQLDLICSHGHTIFHQPPNSFTFQLGDGNAIYSIVGIPVVFDFRSLDVQLGGQGAPLVPVGDRYLFSEFDVCLNLGGIANLSVDRKKKRIAFDVCFANMGLNFLMQSAGKNFDEGGSLSRKGNVDELLLKELNSKYKPFRKFRNSLAREQFEESFLPVLNNNQSTLENKLRTFSESIALQISDVINNEKKIKRVLVTGGGSKNKFLIELLQEKLRNKIKIIVPDESLIDFKEAIVFGLLGVLRKLNQKNVLKSVTQSRKNSISGLMIG